MSATQTPFSPIDELLDLTDSARYPVNVHIEAKAPGTLDADKMRAAVRAAVDAHPLARARKVAPQQRDKQLYWEITEAPGIDPFMVAEGGDEAGVSLARNQFLSTQVPLHESPPLRVLLVRGDSADHLILNVSHAAGEDDRIAYGCHNLTLEVEDVAQLNPKKYIDGTFNDLLVAAMHRTVDIWNDSHGSESALVRVLSPVNLRPREWWFEVFGNFAMSFATNTESGQREDPAALLASVIEQSRLAKEEDFAESMLLGLGLSTRLPVWVKNLMFQGSNDTHTASATLTNAGRISEPLSFGSDGDALEIWMSPPAVMPDGVGLGVTNYNGKLHLSFRHSYELFDDQAAAEFAAMFHQSLLWLS